MKITGQVQSEDAPGFAAGSWALGPIDFFFSPQLFFRLRYKEPKKHCGIPMANLETFAKKT